MSCLSRASCSSRVVAERPPDWRANTMSIAIRNSSTPPAILKAGSPIPKVRSSQSPLNAKISRIMAASSVPLMAMRRRWIWPPPWVSAPNMGVTPIGSTTTNSTMNMLTNFPALPVIRCSKLQGFTHS